MISNVHTINLLIHLALKFLSRLQQWISLIKNAHDTRESRPHHRPVTGKQLNQASHLSNALHL